MAEETKQMSEEEMLAAMEAAAEGGPTGEDGKALSQDEIDSLLGFEATGGENKTGIQALLERALLSYERLPMLEVIFDHYVRTLSTSLRNFTNENVDVSIDSITSMRFEDYLNSVPLPALLSIFQAIEWENYGLIIIDSSLAYSMVDVLLGGGKTHRPIKVEGRPFSTIEQDIVKTMAGLMLEDLSTAFNPLTPATFRVERLETNPRFATITRPSNAVILLSLRVDIDDRGGKAEILIPYGTIEPVKDLLTQMFTGEDFGSDNSWEDYFTTEVQQTNICLSARFSAKKITLKELAGLKIGSTIIMDNTPNDDIDLECNGVKMLSGKVGAMGSNIAVRISEIHQKKMVEGLLG